MVKSFYVNASSNDIDDYHQMLIKIGLPVDLMPEIIEKSREFLDDELIVKRVGELSKKILTI